MSEIISYGDVESRIIEIRGEKVILDRDVAELYGVETKHINQAVRNNPDKFPDGYVFELSTEEISSLRSKFLTLNEDSSLKSENVTLKSNKRGQNIKYPPKAFTEKGLYMLATILKSPVATQTTIAIVEAFANLRELSSVLKQLPEAKNKDKHNALLRKSGEIFGNILDNDALEIYGDETSVELNLALVNFKHTVKRKKRE